MRTAVDPKIRFDRFVRRSGEHGCWLWSGTRSNRGYGQMGYGKGLITAHRFSWMAHKGPIPDGMFVLHKCDVRACVNPDHLFLGTASDNTRDMVAKGRARGKPHPGEAHGASKLTDSDVRAIRSTAGSLTDLAAKFGVHRTTIHRVRTHRAWSHVD